MSRLPSILQYDAVTAWNVGSANLQIMQEKSSAHDRNDQTLKQIYIGRGFKNDTERLEKLFELNTKMTAKKAPNDKKI